MKTERIRAAIIHGLAPLEAGECDTQTSSDIRQMNAVLEAIPTNRRAVFLTDGELAALRHVIRNGWGDGDFAEILRHPATIQAAMRGAEKLGVGLSGG